MVELPDINFFIEKFTGNNKKPCTNFAQVEKNGVGVLHYFSINI